MKFGGLILAAGESSRMGDFKPLLELRGKTVIENSLMSLMDAGVSDICVVLGKNLEDVKRVLSKYKIKIVINENYSRTEMFDSMKIGLKELLDNDAILYLPGDCPVVKSSTVKSLMSVFENNEVEIVYPTYRNKKGHPPVIGKQCYNKILEFEEAGGLREVFKRNNCSSILVETNDNGTVLDIDNKDDYLKIIKDH